MTQDDKTVLSYRARMVLPESGSPDVSFFTHSGLRVATGYSRVVIGGRGAYIEFSPSHVTPSSMSVPEAQAWRTDPVRGKNAFYVEYRTVDSCSVKVYLQTRRVAYADYLPGCFYVFPGDLTSDRYPSLILPPAARERRSALPTPLPFPPPRG